MVWRRGIIPALKSPMHEYRIRHLCSQRILMFIRITVVSLAFVRRFERPTPNLGGWCSILLSYTNISFYIISYLYRFCKSLAEI